jgi:hypothetical protein
MMISMGISSSVCCSMPVMQSSRRALWAPEGYSIWPIYAMRQTMTWYS